MPEYGHSGLAAFENVLQRDTAMTRWISWIALQPSYRRWRAAPDYSSGIPGGPGVHVLNDYDVRGNGQEIVPAFTTHHSFLAESNLDDPGRAIDDYDNVAHLAFSAIGDGPGGYGPQSWTGARFPH